eukprot:m.677460 g.677460  ORF g.677460 m.677460 type:complete len:839 (+) comp22796_c0_seq2:481-2997(+)
MFWAPELERERRARITERNRANKAEKVLKEQLEKGVKYMKKLMELEKAYEELEDGAQKQARMEAELRSNLEVALSQQGRRGTSWSDISGSGSEAGSSQGNAALLAALQRHEYDIKRRDKDLVDANDKIRLLGEQLAKAEDKVQAYNMTLRTVTSLRAELEAAKATSATDSASQEQIRADARRETHRLATQLQARETECAALRQDHDAVEKRLQTALTDCASAQAAIADLTQNVELKNREVHKQQAEIDAMNTAATELRTELENARGATNTQREASLEHSRTIARLHADVADTKETVAKREDELTAVKADLSGARSIEAALRSELQALQHTYQDATAELDVQADKVSELQRELQMEKDAHAAVCAAQQSTQAELDVKLEGFMTAISGLEVQLEAKDAEVAGLTAEMERSSLSTDDAKAQNEKITARVAKLEKELTMRTTELQRANEAHRAAVKELSDKEAGLKAEVSGLKAEIAKQKLRLQSQARKNADLQTKLTSSTTTAETQTKKFRQCQADMANATAKLASQRRANLREKDAHKKLIQTHEADIKALTDKLTKATADLTKKQTECTELQQQVNELKSTAAGLEAEKEALLSSGQEHSAKAATLATDITAAEQRAKSAEDSLARTRTQLADTRDKLAALQQSMIETEERSVEDKTNQILAFVSEMDVQIAALESDGAKKNRDQIQHLLQKRAEHVAALKQQFDKRSAMLHGDGSDRPSKLSESLTSIGSEARMDLHETLELKQEDAVRLRKYIDQLMGEVLKQDEAASSAVFNGLPRLQQDTNFIPTETMKDRELQALVDQREADVATLEEYVDTLLNRIVEHCPRLLETGAFMMSP